MAAFAHGAMLESQRLLVDIIQADHRHKTSILLLLGQILEATDGKTSSVDVRKELQQLDSSLQDSEFMIKQLCTATTPVERLPRHTVVDDVRKHASEVVLTVCAESRQLQDEMKKLAVAAQANVDARFQKLESRLRDIEQEEFALLKSGIEERYGCLREVTMEVTKRVDKFDQTLEEEKKARLAVEDKLDKQCTDMRREIEDVLKEHLRMPGSAPEVRPAVPQVPSLRGLLQDPKAARADEEEISTSLSPKSFHTTADSGDEEGREAIGVKTFYIGEEDRQPEVVASIAEVHSAAKSVIETEAATGPEAEAAPTGPAEPKAALERVQPEAFEAEVEPNGPAEPKVAVQAELTTQRDAAAESTSTGEAEVKRRTDGATAELAAKLDKINDKIRNAPGSTFGSVEATEDGDRARALWKKLAIVVQVGHAVKVKSSGRQGVVIVKDDDPLLPYKVKFNDGETPLEDWVGEDTIEMLAQ